MNICKKCNGEFVPKPGLVNYCSLICRNSRNFSDEAKRKKSLANKGKRMSEASKAKRIQTNLERYGVQYHNFKGDAAFELRECKMCQTFFKIRISSPKKTCSRLCSIQASMSRTYRNGSRKTIYYNGIVLESSWELTIAILLDSLNIDWCRPDPIIWYDNKNVSHLYYPDFYLPKYDVYLDPKNPYCMERDKQKLEYITTVVNIIYGPLEDIKTYIVGMV